MRGGGISLVAASRESNSAGWTDRQMPLEQNMHRLMHSSGAAVANRSTQHHPKFSWMERGWWCTRLLERGFIHRWGKRQWCIQIQENWKKEMHKRERENERGEKDSVDYIAWNKVVEHAQLYRDDGFCLIRLVWGCGDNKLCMKP